MVITTPFGFHSTAREVLAGVDLHGKRAIVTGGASGIGAAMSVLLAASSLLAGVTGRYFDDCNEAVVLERRSPGPTGVAPHALDPENAERLWESSLRILA